MGFFRTFSCIGRHWLALALIGLISISAVPSAHAQQGFKIVKYNGSDYVTLDSIKDFYGFTQLRRNGNRIVLDREVKREGRVVRGNDGKPVIDLTVEMRIGAQECLMNNVKFVFTDKVEVQGATVLVSRMDLAKLIDPVLRPNYISNAGRFNTVIIDPGHGGKDPGAVNPLGTEAHYNLVVSRMLKKRLEDNGYRVVMTRDSDRYLSLQERVDVANAVKEPAIFISIHFNSGGRNARGIETFTLSPPGVSHYGRGLNAGDFKERAGNAHDSANIALATSVHGQVLHSLGTNTFDRGIKRARFSVLSGVRHPAILFEGGFMSHPYEARLIHNERYQQAVAAGIANAVTRYRRAVGRH